MGKIRIAVLFLLLICLLGGCAPEQRETLGWGESAFECEVSWERRGEHIRAVLFCGESGVEGERDISLRFEEPKAMKGVCLIREGGKTRVCLDGVTVTMGDTSGWLDIMRIFDTEGEISYLSSDTVDGEEVDRLLLTRTDGGESEIYISRRSELPLRIITYIGSQRIDARILYFTEKTEM